MLIGSSVKIGVSFGVFGSVKNMLCEYLHVGDDVGKARRVDRLCSTDIANSNCVITN